MVIKPGKEFIISVGILLITIIVLFFVTLEDIFFSLIYCGTIAFFSIRSIISFGRTITMNENGCMVSFGKYKKWYSWDDLKVKRIESYKNSMSLTAPNIKSVMFSSHSVFKPSWIMAGTYSAFISPFSCIYMYLLPSKDMKENRSAIYLNYVIDEDIFWEKMKQWNIF